MNMCIPCHPLYISHYSGTQRKKPQYPQWVLTGSRADAKISISEILKANVDGSIKTDKRDLEDECSTGE